MSPATLVKELAQNGSRLKEEYGVWFGVRESSFGGHELRAVASLGFRALGLGFRASRCARCL